MTAVVTSEMYDGRKEGYEAKLEQGEATAGASWTRQQQAGSSSECCPFECVETKGMEGHEERELRIILDGGRETGAAMGKRAGGTKWEGAIGLH
jgi:hypothetical protein